MARRSQGAPGVGYDVVAAAVAEHGSERKAASALGVARSTLNGILRGVHGAGQKVTAALAAAPKSAEYKAAAPTFRGGRAGVQRAYRVAKQERKEPGALRRQLTAVQEAQAPEPTQASLDINLPPALAKTIRDGRNPGETIESAVRRLAGDQVWDRFVETWAAGQTREDWYEMAIEYEYEQAADAGIAGLLG